MHYRLVGQESVAGRFARRNAIVAVEIFMRDLSEPMYTLRIHFNDHGDGHGFTRLVVSREFSRYLFPLLFVSSLATFFSYLHPLVTFFFFLHPLATYFFFLHPFAYFIFCCAHVAAMRLSYFMRYTMTQLCAICLLTLSG